MEKTTVETMIAALDVGVTRSAKDQGMAKLTPLHREVLSTLPQGNRQEVRVLGDGRALVRVREAPFFVVARAAEPSERLRVFAPVEPSGLWVELGWHHPLAEAIERPAEGSLLIFGDGHEWIFRRRLLRAQGAGCQHSQANRQSEVDSHGHLSTKVEGFKSISSRTALPRSHR